MLFGTVGGTSLKFGYLENHKVGQIFSSRKELSKSGLHAPTMAGIWGRENEGACSIVMSGGYEDDIDNMDCISYTGHGGQDSPGGKQVRDQQFVRGNKALQISFENNLPLRVTRVHQLPNGPEVGYRYDGLYYINHIEKVIGISGFKVCRFHLQSENTISWLENTFKENLKKTYKRTSRSQSITNKIDRNIALAEKIKEFYNYTCQICNQYLEKPNGGIAVGAHIKGLGRPHDGPDDLSNMLCLCPNHHAQFDAFSLYIDSRTLEIIGLRGFNGKKIKIIDKLKINFDFLDYHKNLVLKNYKN